jgi:AraC family transcriptional regulator of adaptative response / DNA-3-methyladenine glycosylase II
VTVHPVTLDISPPFQAEALLTFFGRHAVNGVEDYTDAPAEEGRPARYRRTLRLPHGPALAELSWANGRFTASLELTDDRDLDVGRARIQQLCDLTTDPVAIAEHLQRDARLQPLVSAVPGLRIPGTVDLHEHLFRTMIGQQISLAGAANCAAKLVVRFGEPYPRSAGDHSRGPGWLFPTAAALAAADPATLPMPRARGRALVLMAEALADGSVRLDRDSDPEEARAQLVARPGIGPWTADYVLMRGLHQPDILLSSDLVIRRELASRQITDTTGWSPWRSYATLHLWRAYTG